MGRPRREQHKSKVEGERGYKKDQRKNGGKRWKELSVTSKRTKRIMNSKSYKSKRLKNL